MARVDRRRKFEQASRQQRAAIDRFLATLPAAAPLHTVVGSAAVQNTLAQFESADAGALAAQSRYLGWGLRGLGATTFGILLGALLLMPLEPWLTGSWRIAIGAFQTLALVVTFGATILILGLKPLDQWMSHRAKAERLRGEIFQTILDVPQPDTADAKILGREKLELINAAYVDDQLDYFHRRAREHRRRASQASPLRLLGYLLIVTATALGFAALARGLAIALPVILERAVDWLAVSDANRWQLGIATVASGLLAFATQRSLMDEDARRAALFTITADKLKRIVNLNLPAVRAAASDGDNAAIMAFFSTVRTILEQEHVVWSFMRPESEI